MHDGFTFPSFRESQIPDAFEASDLKRAIDLGGTTMVPRQERRCCFNESPRR